MDFIRAEIKRGFLRQLCEVAKKSSSTLKDILLAAQGGIFSANFQRGKILISTSGSGQSGNFEIGLQGKEFTQENCFAMFETMLTTLEALISKGAIDDGQPGSTDALFTAMVDTQAFEGITQQMGDFSGLNFPANSTR